MEASIPSIDNSFKKCHKKPKLKFNLRSLRLSLKYRPEIFKLVLKMRLCLLKKNMLLKKMKQKFKEMEKYFIEDTAKTSVSEKTIHVEKQLQDEQKSRELSTQTDDLPQETTQKESNKQKSRESSTQTDDLPQETAQKESGKQKSRESSIQTDDLAEERAKKKSNKQKSRESSTQTNDLPQETTQKESEKQKSRESSTQTDDLPQETAQKESLQSKTPINSDDKDAEAGWNLKTEEGKSIADQVKEAAQSALQQSGMVYVDSAGMYYDYKTGYYYNSELGLYYHTDTNCYYYYKEDKKEFVFHSYPDRSAINASLEAHKKRQARKQRKVQKPDEDVENLTKSLSKGDEATKAKRRKKDKKVPKEKKPQEDKKPDEEKKESEIKIKDDEKPMTEQESTETEATEEKKAADEEIKDEIKEEKKEENGALELEDGECSETDSEDTTSSDEESNASTASLNDDDSVAKHHPPCMRIIVKETKLPKLKVGSLFLVTKDGGTIGREGEQHTILLRDQNVSRNHLDIKYNMEKRMYIVTDLGSKNGTVLNGVQMSESQIVSQPLEVMHGSILQLGETKLLCHIHPGNDTCGHCEPGLIMETQEKEKVAYTRTCNVKKQYELELARLKNKYKPEPLMIEDGSYTDRAKARRETVGSSHSSEKTETTNVETHIAEENKGFKLLQKMGWSKGEGLGKDNQGETAPIPLVGNEGTVGLGTAGSVAQPPLFPKPRVRNTLGPATLRLATRSKLLQPPAKAFQADGDEDDE